MVHGACFRGLGLIVKKTAKSLAYRSRYRALSSVEQVLSRKYKKFILTLLAKQKIEERAHEKTDRLTKLFIIKYLKLVIDTTSEPLTRRPSYYRDIRSFTPS